MVAVTVIYLNYKEQKEQTVSNLIASLLKQMVQDHPTGIISNDVKTLHSHHVGRGTRPTLDQFIKALEVEIALYSKVFIVVDALDECEDHETRAKLLRVLRSLEGSVRLMATSRDLPSIAQAFQDVGRLDIRAHDQDIERYIKVRIDMAPQLFKKLQKEIMSGIVENAAGM